MTLPKGLKKSILKYVLESKEKSIKITTSNVMLRFKNIKGTKIIEALKELEEEGEIIQIY